MIASFQMDEEGHCLQIHLDENEEKLSVGEIRIAKVMNVAWGIRAAFVLVSARQTCYLPLDEMDGALFTHKGASPRLQQGDELVVQIRREAMGNKIPSVSGRIELAGRLVILHSVPGRDGISKKIASSRRAQLRELASLISETYPECSFVIRTAAESAGDQEILEEAAHLAQQFGRLREKARHLVCFSSLLKPRAPWLSRVLAEARNASSAESSLEILLEDEMLFQEVQSMLTEEDISFRSVLPGRRKPALIREQSAGDNTDASVSQAGLSIRLYQDDLLSLRKLYGLEHLLEKALGKTVHLSSGANLVIEPTEALTVIDINTGKSDILGKHGRKPKESVVLQVNLEAGSEVLRQLRLRNLSGIIVVDFINMEEEASRQALLHHLAQETRQDSVPCKIVDITPLGLVEITRAKRERNLYEAAAACGFLRKS